MANEKFYKLKDKGHSFSDHSQNAKIVGDRIGKLKATSNVLAAIKANVLVEYTDKNAEAEYAAQEEALDALREKQKTATDARLNNHVHVTVEAPAAEAKGKTKEAPKEKEKEKEEPETEKETTDKKEVKGKEKETKEPAKTEKKDEKKKGLEGLDD